MCEEVAGVCEEVAGVWGGGWCVGRWLVCVWRWLLCVRLLTEVAVVSLKVGVAIMEHFISSSASRKSHYIKFEVKLSL